ncbi:permease prefix domain 1-containing protein [Agromyces ramosus]|uniref:Membrane protein DUF2157 n=1 Tax=Agromyces ramosus TaxID=33879 RepID=A0ABU0R3Y1_9MICO|nr:permease prefix domain 1-containing protein [Agromyces ramosus]MDQ0892763.1 hypothetical protein [Agromyces ramosus]
MNATDPIRRSTDVHRLLDDAFAGVELTPEVQDLKEEIRDNLLSRVAELEASGIESSDAARRAMNELGDVRALVDDDATTPMPVRVESASAAALRNRVRPNPGFVVRTVLLSIVAAAALVVLVLALLGVLSLGTGMLTAIAAVFGVALGIVTADALRQETTANHPLPAGRAVAFGVSTGLLLAGLAFTATVILRLDLAWLILSGLLVVAAIAALSYLGATQTNRHKPWVVVEQRATTVANRFDEDPAAAARFGIYTAAIWTVAFVVAVVLGFTVGWWWAPVALVAGFVAMLVTLARMLFGADARRT